MEQLSTQPEIFARLSAMADPIRARLLRILDKHELGVAELCDVLKLPQSTVSRHLKVLSEQNWVISRRLATNNLYRMIQDELSPSARKLWHVTREQTEDWPAVGQDQLRLTRCLRDRKADAQAFFNSTAGQWDSMREELYGKSFLVEAILSLLPSDWTVVDLGCGTGQLVEQLSRHVKRVIGIDNSQAMLKAAGKRTKDYGNVELLKSDLTELPRSVESCDAAVMILSLSYVENVPAVLKEMTRILKPGGKAVIVDLLAHDQHDFRRQMGQQCLGFSTTELSNLMTTAGLADVSVKELSPESSAKGPALFVASGRRN